MKTPYEGNAFDIGLYTGTGTFKEGRMKGAYAYAGAGLAGVDCSTFDVEDTDGDTSDYLRGVNRPRPRDRARDRARARARAYARGELVNASGKAAAILASASPNAQLASSSVSVGPLEVRGSLGEYETLATMGPKASVTCDAAGLFSAGGIDNNIDRPLKLLKNDVFVGALAYDGADKAGVYAGVGVAHAKVECSILDAEVKGPNVEAGAEVSLTSIGAFARAELASASVSAGPLKAKVGLSADAGVKVSLTSVEAEIFGTGIKFGRTMGVSLFGTGFEVKLW